MKIDFDPQGNHDITLDSLAVSGDVLSVNGTPYDLSSIPDGATLPNAEQATGSPFFRRSIDRIDGELHVTILLPQTPDSPYEARFPEPVIVQNGNVPIPGVTND